MNRLYTAFIIAIISIGITNAQSSFINEWEAQIGYMNFQGDYGVRSDFGSTLGNSGAIIGGKVYLNFLDNERINCYSCTHLKFNVSFNTGYSALSYGSAYEDDLSLEGIKLKAISGQYYFLGIGLNAEYHLSDLKNIDFFSSSFLNKFDPYIGIGGGVTFYNADVESALGNLEKSPEIVPLAFKDGIFQGSGLTPMANLELGIRYRFDEKLQFVFSNKWRYYFSDKVDGVVPDKEQVDNLYNDWMFTPSFGVVIFIY